MAGKYAPLGAHLRAQRARKVAMSFADIERVIGDRLPTSARRHRPWWSNNPLNSVVTKTWLEAGFKAEAVDLDRETLVFRRLASREERGDEEMTTSRHPLFGCMKGLIHVAPGTDLTEPADPEWADLYD